MPADRRPQPRAGVDAGMSELLALGISHKTAPVALRERLAFTERAGGAVRRRALATPEVREAVVISTCNRTEVYLVVGDSVRAEATTCWDCSPSRAEIRPTELADAIYSPRNCDAARQLYRVTAGLESMIVGEAEIQGQVRRAHEAAMRAGCTGPLSNRLFAAALTTGKRVRSETSIGASRVSVPVGRRRPRAERARRADSSATWSILGAGETSELTARALSEQGAGTIFVANRHADRALSLAQRFGGSVVGLDELPEQLLHADIVLSSTASPHPIVGREELEVVMSEREGRRALLLIDIAVPRDIDPGCAEHRGRHAVRHRRPAGGRRAQPQHARGGDAAGAGDRRGGDPPLRALARPARRAAHGQRAARTRQRDRRAGARRERGALGDGLGARPRARGGDRAGGHEPPAARAHDPPAQPRRAIAAMRASSWCASCSGCARTRPRADGAGRGARGGARPGRARWRGRAPRRRRAAS